MSRASVFSASTPGTVLWSLRRPDTLPTRVALSPGRAHRLGIDRLLILFLSCGVANAGECVLHPIALPETLVVRAAPGTVVPNLPRGQRPGQFGWLSWSGSPSLHALVASLAPEGDSHTYVNPDQPTDHQIDPGDWISGRPGLAESRAVRDTLGRLLGREIVVPTWDLARGHGERAAYRIAGFVRVVLLEEDLCGPNHLALRYLGPADCSARNLAPNVDAGPDQTLDEPGTLILSGQVTDDGLPGAKPESAWAQLSGPAAVEFDDAALPDTAARFPVAGDYTLRLTATDGALTASDEVCILVSSSNEPPIARSLEVTTFEDTPTLVTLDGVDPDADPLVYRVVTPPNHGVLSDDTSAPTSLRSGTLRTFTYTPSPDYNGVDVFTYVGSDGQCESAPASVTVVITPVNDPPVAAAATLVTDEDTPQTLTLSGADLEDAVLSFTIVRRPLHGLLCPVPPSAGSFPPDAPDAPGQLEVPLDQPSTSNQFLYHPAPEFSGTDSFEFQVGDGELVSETVTVTLVVRPVNDPPSVSAGADRLLTLPEASTELAGVVLDDSLPPLTLRWEKTVGPGHVTFADPTAASTTAQFIEAGHYTLVLTADDGEFSVPDALDVMVHAPPTASAGPNRLVTVGDWSPLIGSAADDGLPNPTLAIRWTITAGPGSVQFEAFDQLTTRARFEAPGSYTICLTADDGAARASAQTTWIARLPLADQPPVVRAGPDRQLGWTSETTLEGEVLDTRAPGGPPLDIVWTVIESPGVVFFASPESPRTRVTFSEAGRYTLRLTASDGATSAHDEVTWEVYPDNLPPVVEAGPERIVVIPDPGTLRADTLQPLAPQIAFGQSLQSVDHWDTTIGNPGLDGSVGYNSLAGSGTNIFVAGVFHRAGNTEAVASARWDGVQWHALFDPRPLPFPTEFGSHINHVVHECGAVEFCNETLNAIGAIGPEAFVAGNIKELSAVTDGTWDLTARWTGATWEPWGFKHQGNHVRAIAATPDRVYLGGYFAFQPADASPLDRLSLPWSYAVAAWDSRSGWRTFGDGIVDLQDRPSSAEPGLLTYHAVVTALVPAADGTVFAGGQFVMETPAGRAHHIARWNGQVWEPLGSGLSGNGRNFVVMALALSPDGSLFVGGNFTNAGGVVVRHVARWDGHQWHELADGPLNGVSSTVNALAVHGHNLYAAGPFQEAGGQPVGGIARWNGLFWSPLGTRTAYGISGTVNSLLADAAGVYVAGNFSAVAGQPAQHIALWRFADPPSGLVTLEGRVTDDGRPVGGQLVTHWDTVAGPAAARFAQPESPITRVDFPAAGTYTLQLAATDGELHTTDITTIEVQANQPPTVDAGPDVVVGQGEPLVLEGRIADDGRPAGVGVYSLWTLVHGPVAVPFSHPVEPVTSVTFSQPGVYQIRLTANDTHFSSSDDLVVTVHAANQPPYVHAGPSQSAWLDGPPVQLQGTVSDDGRPGGPVRCLWSVASGPGTVRFAEATSPTTIASFERAGNYQLRLAAADGELSQSALVSLAILLPANQPPFVDAGPAQRVTNWFVRLAGQVDDDGYPAANTLSVQWLAASGPGTVTFANAQSPATIATFSRPGDYWLQLTASDGAYTRYDGTPITIVGGAPPLPGDPNQAPIVDLATSTTVSQTNALLLPCRILDDARPDFGRLTASWTKVSGPGRVRFTAARLESALPALELPVATEVRFDAPGRYTVRLAADDGQLAAFSDLLVEVLPDDPNQPPTVEAGSDLSVLADQPARLQPRVADDGLPAASSLRCLWTSLSGPARVYFDDPARLDTIALCHVPGDYTLQLVASDGRLTATDRVGLRVVAPTNQPPLVDAGPDLEITRPAPALLAGTALDDGLPTGMPFLVSWSALAGPGQVALQPATQAVAQATFSASGSYTLQLAATDSAITRADTVTVRVRDGVNRAPQVEAGADLTIALGDLAPLDGAITDDGLPDGRLTSRWRQLEGPGVTTFLAVNGRWYARFNTAGTFTLEFTASDGPTTATDSLTVTVVADVQHPIVHLESLTNFTPVTAPVTLLGTVSSPLLRSWQLAVRSVPPSSTPDPESPWTILATGHAAADAAPLAVFDPTLLHNGLCEVQLAATDQTARRSTDHRLVLVDGRLKPGVVTLSFTDLTIPIAGLPLRLTRTYDTRNALAARSGDFGVGWSLSLADIRVQKSGRLGADWHQSSSGGWFTLQATRPHVVTVTLPGGRMLRFLAQTDPVSQFGHPIEWASLRFLNLPGTLGRLEIDGPDSAGVAGFSGPAELLELERFEVFDPSTFRLVTPDGWQLRCNEGVGLLTAQDPHGRTLALHSDGLTHSSGLSVPFERDSLGRITALTDPAGGRVRYDYDDHGTLAGVTDPTGRRTSFTYDSEHRLLTITDAAGVVRLAHEYDLEGRLIGQTDAASAALRIERDLLGRCEMVTDRLGRRTTHLYDDRGNVVASSDPLGYLTAYEYDSRDRLTAVTRFAHPIPRFPTLGSSPDPLCRTVRFTYDEADHLTSLTDPLGHTTGFQFHNRGTLLSLQDPLGHGLTNVADSGGILLASVDALGQATTYGHQDGLLTTVTNALGGVSRLAYDTLGCLTNVTDPLGRFVAFERDPLGRVTRKIVGGPALPAALVTEFHYDPAGRLTNQIAPDGASAAIYYDAPGRAACTIDPLGRITEFVYDACGRLTLTRYPDGTTLGRAWDAEDRLVAVTNQLGQVTRLHRDALGRVIRVERPDGASSTNYLDGFGQLIATTNPRGQTTWFGYDLAGRLHTVTNSLGDVTRTTFDPNGNPVQLINPLGQVTTTDFDPLNRPRRCVYADGAVASWAYDALGRLIAAVDPGGHATLQTYDAAGRLVTLTNTLGGVTRYAYDDLDRLVALTDPNGHTTTFNHDTLGRLTGRTLPLGQHESFEYDLAGRPLRHTDFNGHTTTFQYDLRGHLTDRIPDPRLEEPQVRLRRDALGRITEIQDAAGRCTFTYSTLGYLIGRDLYLRGLQSALALRYDRDLHGNLTRLRSSTGATDVTYDYDALDRLAAVTASGVGRTDYTYDRAGRLAACRLANGLTYHLTHDALGRLLHLGALTGGGPVADYHYTLDVLGRRSHVEETLTVDQQPAPLRRSWEYDALSHLLTETTTSPQQSDPVARQYTYDLAGNRLTSTLHAPGALPVSTLFVYDPNDRLLTLLSPTAGSSPDNSAAPAATFTYDAAGNAVAGTDPDGLPFADTYDSFHRLLRRSQLLNGQPATIEFACNAQGARLLKTVVAAGRTETTLYLVDDQNPTGLPQVLEELRTDNGGALTLNRAHLFGLTLLAQRRPSTTGWTTEFAGLDALGSVRFLTDPTGRLLTFHDFDAFGNLVDGARWDPASLSWESIQATPTDPAAPRSSLSAAGPLLFAGAWYDPDLRLYHLGARDYDPILGRFRTADPFGGFAADPPSLHRYHYARNNPVNRTDPTGYYDLASVSLGIAIGRTLHDMYDGSVMAAGYGLMHSLEGLAQGKTEEQILLEYETGTMIGAAAGVALAKVVQIAGRALTGELPLPSPRRLTAHIRDLLNGNILWARNTLARLRPDSPPTGHPAGTPPHSSHPTSYANWGAEFVDEGMNVVPSVSLQSVAGSAPHYFKAEPSIPTPYGLAFQDGSDMALAVLGQVQNGSPLYKGGRLGTSETGASQFLSLGNPLAPDYVNQYGIPPQNAAFDFVLTGELKPGAPAITRRAPGIGPNVGGAIEVVTEAGSFQVNSFHMP